MQHRIASNWNRIDLSVSFLFLVLLFWFTFIFLVKVPYAGFYINPRDGQVAHIFVENDPTNLLLEGDIIRQVDNVSWESYRSNTTQGFFAGIRKGQVVDISIDRNGQVFTVKWPFPGFNEAEFKGRFYNIWWLGYFFWFFGLLTQLLIYFDTMLCE